MTTINSYRIAAAILGWFSLALQFALFVGDPAPPSAPVAIVNYFSYFTILTNIAVALALSAGVARHPGSFFNRAGPRAAIALYILVVGAVYHVMLRNAWDPQGWALVADLLLHYAMPLLYLIDWAAFAPKRSLALRMVPGWLVYPAAYGAYAVARGATTGFYPYPFLDAERLGFPAVALNLAVLVAVFGVGGLVLIGLSRALPQGRAR